MAGVFDPIHDGHIKFIEETINNLGLDKFFILIEEKSRHKGAFADFRHRKEIVRLSIKDRPKIDIYPSETTSFPISSTLPKIKSAFKDAKLYLLIGSDVEKHIDSWPDAGNLLKGVEIIVADRNSTEDYRKISSGKVRQQIKTKAAKTDISKEALDYCIQNNLYR